MIMVTPTSGRLDADSTCLLRTGGAESNVAMYLSDFGHSTAWASRLGDDVLGRIVLSEIRAAGVDTSYVELLPDRPTGVYFKDPGPDGTRVLYYRRGSAASTMDPAFADGLRNAVPSTVVVSGVTPALSAECRAATDLLITDRLFGEASVVFDVNHRPALWPDGDAPDVLRHFALAADVVFVGLDEAERLWGSRTPQEVREVLDRPATLVVKDGARDATCFHDDGQDVVPAPAVDVVEAVGAGDAFAAGWISGMLRGLDQRTRLRLGHLVAGVALTSVGDHGPLPPASVICSQLGIDEETWAMRSAATPLP
jgi:2-dehydro-3-deoxygluconokinase